MNINKVQWFNRCQRRI